MLVVIVAFLTVVSAARAVVLYGQCGGSGYTGSTTCDLPAVCTVINSFYSQCLIPSITINTTTAASSTAFTSPSASASSCSQPVPTGPCGLIGNPYAPGYTPYVNPQYATAVTAAAAAQTNPATQTKFIAASKIPNFIWISKLADVPSLSTYLADAQSKQIKGVKMIVQIVIYDLPNRDCHATTSDGEYNIANNGVALYKSFIDALSAAISAYPDVRVVAIFEPSSLVNLIVNLSDPKCANAAQAYQQLTQYALVKLQQCNLWIYLDGGSAGVLGWPANLAPAAQLFGNVYAGAYPNRVRGLATNIAGYNPYSTTTADPVTSGNPNYDELHYINALAPLLIAKGFPAFFLVDQSRSGVQGIRTAWSDWCNIRGAGFGLRPGTAVGSCYVDQIVWVKNGGISDGTSSPSAATFSSSCALSDAKVPSPVAGTWFGAYFEDLVANANPAF